MTAMQKSLFWAILLLYLVAGVLYAVLTPTWQAPDEPAHYNYTRYLYTRYLAASAAFPELVASCYDESYLSRLKERQFPAELSIDAVCYEFHQPPLYYVLGTPVFILSNGAVVALRLLSVALGAGVVVLAFFIGKTVLPYRLPVAYGTMAFVAFVPMHVAILASVNNDSLAELLLATLLFLFVQRLSSATPASSKNDLLCGVVLGLGLITKTTVYIAVPLVAVMLWLEIKSSKPKKSKWPTLFKHAAIIYSTGLIIALPWYIRNAVVYGGIDILGLIRHDEIVAGQLRTSDFLARVGGAAYAGNFVTTTFRSFWGQFGWMAVPMDGRTYTLLTLLCLIALGGLIAFWLKPSSPPLKLTQGNALLLLGSVILLMAVGYIGYNLTFVQFQGRYLFPSLIPLGVFFSLGLAEALNRRWTWWLAGGLLAALIWVAVTSARSGGLDKWAILIIGMALILAAARPFIERYWPRLTPWLLALCFLGLALLTLAGPFWFVVPYL